MELLGRQDDDLSALHSAFFLFLYFYLYKQHLFQRCNLLEPLKYENGKPCMPQVINEPTLPGFLTSKSTLEHSPCKNDTRLRIFSGTANPAFAQVSAHFFFNVGTLKMETRITVWLQKLGGGKVMKFAKSEESYKVCYYYTIDVKMVALYDNRKLHAIWVLNKIKIKRFADGEIYVQLQESVRGCDGYLVQPTCPSYKKLMELFIMIDACRRASAKTITIVTSDMQELTGRTFSAETVVLSEVDIDVDVNTTEVDIDVDVNTTYEKTNVYETFSIPDGEA
ncbi:Ribose-phosphate pyrophosphokinase, N-terminal domain [Dillenia turbinata]|uniref:Ribose-phosphate pyrophosphokinase, N-terminal domain n=1 Tax=Dillenia turbinata TaxID=194707 RepID=A0AAN8YYS8_9MAGN